MIASDTIVAIATPPGQGGVGIVRLSGPEARGIGAALFVPSHAGAAPRARRLVHGRLHDPATGTLLDEALVSLMPNPHSYTGEDVLELHCHGSPVVLERVISCCLALGARLAERGEFTLRAFLNGRLDLAQAEAVSDLVRARTPTAAQVAAQALTGALARRLTPLAATLTGTLAYLEATIDFVEEDLPTHEAPRLAATVREIHAALDELLRRAGHGALLRDGVRVVLAGKPNVGKSSLLNALLRRDRAIVTPIPGTTRDTLEEAVDIHGLPMYLVDTAGLSESDDPVERLGIARGAEAIRAAALVALVVDGSAPPDRADLRAAAEVRRVAPNSPMLLVRNKRDLPCGASPDAFTNLAPDATPPWRTVSCSAVSGEGLAELEDILADMALGGEALDAEQTLVENARQRQALSDAVTALAAAAAGLDAKLPAELICIDLRAALDALGALTGENVGEAVLDRIFADFCLGK